MPGPIAHLANLDLNLLVALHELLRERSVGVAPGGTFGDEAAHAVRLSLASARHARRLQSGSLGTYVVYLIGLVLVLLAAARLGLIG